jgi:hypothetical protein
MYDYSTIIKNTGFFFDLILLDLHLPYAGVSVYPVTHIQRLLAYVLLEKLFLTFVRKKLGT